MFAKLKKILPFTLIIFSLLFISSCNLIPAICTHESTSWHIVNEATATEEGERKEVCNSCNEVLKTDAIPRPELSQEVITEKLSHSVFKVYSYSADNKNIVSQGSGFFIDANGNFLTNAHVVDDTYFLKIELANGEKYDVDKIYKFNYETSDFALCHAKIENTSAVKFCEKVRENDTVYALGYPNDSEMLTVTKGTMLDLKVKSGDIHYYATNAKIDNGSSGGILSNAQGEVIGITTCMFEDSTYGSIKYTDIKSELADPYFEFSSPVDYFHQLVEIELNDQNVRNYFEIVNAKEPVRFGNQYHFELYLILKPQYRETALALRTETITFTVDFKTIYKYKDNQNIEQTKVDVKQISFTASSDKDLNSGVSENFYVTVSTSGINTSGEISYRFEAQITDALGSIVYYD